MCRIIRRIRFGDHVESAIQIMEQLTDGKIGGTKKNFGDECNQLLVEHRIAQTLHKTIQNLDKTMGRFQKLSRDEVLKMLSDIEDLSDDLETKKEKIEDEYYQLEREGRFEEAAQKWIEMKKIEKELEKL